MNAQHTPGPWHANALGYIETGAPPTGRRLQIVGGADQRGEKYAIGSQAAHVCTVDRGGESAQADARLISAAPELLAALDAIINHAEFENPLSARKVIAARAALAKAKGEA